MNPFLLGYPFCWHIIFHKVFLHLCISVVSVWLPSFIFVFIALVHLSFLMILAKVYQFCLSFQRKPLRFSILFLLWSLLFLSFYYLHFFFLLFLVPLHVQMDCLFEGFVCLFPEEGCITTNFPLRTALFGSHRFWTVYFYLYMSSIFFLFFYISFWFFSVTSWLV